MQLIKQYFIQAATMWAVPAMETDGHGSIKRPGSQASSLSRRGLPRSRRAKFAGDKRADSNDRSRMRPSHSLSAEL